MSINAQLLEIKQLLDTNTKIINGEVYLPHDIENKFFKLLYRHPTEVRLPENVIFTKEISDKIYYVLTHVIAGGECGIKTGQTTYNAAADEINIHETYGWAYGGGDELDHYYHHTGIGIPGADFVLNEPFAAKIFNKETHEIELVMLPKDCQIDAKLTTDIDLFYKEYIITNSKGKLGHYGDKLLIHLLGTNSYYLADNTADTKLLPLIDFTPKCNYLHYGITLANDGILTIYKCWDKDNVE